MPRKKAKNLSIDIPVRAVLDTGSVNNAISGLRTKVDKRKILKVAKFGTEGQARQKRVIANIKKSGYEMTRLTKGMFKSNRYMHYMAGKNRDPPAGLRNIMATRGKDTTYRWHPSDSDPGKSIKTYIAGVQRTFKVANRSLSEISNAQVAKELDMSKADVEQLPVNELNTIKTKLLEKYEEEAMIQSQIVDSRNIAKQAAKDIVAQIKQELKMEKEMEKGIKSEVWAENQWRDEVIELREQKQKAFQKEIIYTEKLADATEDWFNETLDQKDRDIARMQRIDRVRQKAEASKMNKQMKMKEKEDRQPWFNRDLGIAGMHPYLRFWGGKLYGGLSGIDVQQTVRNVTTGKAKWFEKSPKIRGAAGGLWKMMSKLGLMEGMPKGVYGDQGTPKGQATTPDTDKAQGEEYSVPINQIMDQAAGIPMKGAQASKKSAENAAKAAMVVATAGAGAGAVGATSAGTAGATGTGAMGAGKTMGGTVSQTAPVVQQSKGLEAKNLEQIVQNTGERGALSKGTDGMMEGMNEQVSKSAEWMGPVAAGISVMAIAGMKMMKDIVGNTEGAKFINAAIQGGIDALVSLVMFAGLGLNELLTTAEDSLAEVTRGGNLLDNLKFDWDKVGDTFKDLWNEKVWPVISAGFNTVFGSIWKTISDFLSQKVTWFDDVVTALDYMINTDLKSLVNDGITVAFDNIDTVLETFFRAVDGVLKTIGVSGDAWEKLKTSIVGALNSVFTFFTDYEYAKTMISQWLGWIMENSVVQGIVDAFNSVGAFFTDEEYRKEKLGEMWEAIGDKLMEWLKIPETGVFAELVKNIKEGIAEGMKGVKVAIDWGSMIKDSIKDHLLTPIARAVSDFMEKWAITNPNTGSGPGGTDSQPN